MISPLTRVFLSTFVFWFFFFIIITIFICNAIILNKGSYLDEHGWSVGDEEDGTARKAYQALLRVSLLKPTSMHFHNFSDMVKQRALEYYNYTLSENEEVIDVFRIIMQFKYYFRSFVTSSQTRPLIINLGELFRWSVLRWCTLTRHGFEWDSH